MKGVGHPFAALSVGSRGVGKRKTLAETRCLGRVEMNRQFSRCISGALSLCVMLACEASSRDVGFVVRDSAGITIVENVQALWTESEGWRIAPEPELVIGADASNPNEQLYVVSQVVLLDTAIIIANNGTSELRVFDRRGNFLRSIGGNGNGPGEFNGLRSLYSCVNDTLVANELRRLSLFNGHGEFVRTIPLIPELLPRPGVVRGVSSDCTAVVVDQAVPTEPSMTEPYAQQMLLLWIPLDGTGRQTIAQVDGPDVLQVAAGDRLVTQRLPWGRLPDYALSDRRLYVGDSDTSEIRVYTTSGLERVIRWTAPRKPVTDRDRDLFREEQAAEIRADGGGLAQLLPSLDDYPHVAGQKPVYSRLIVDDVGNLWVREYPDVIGWDPTGRDVDRDGAPENWWVFDADGRLLESVVVPATLRVLSVQDDYLIAIAFDENDVEQLSLYRIEGRESGESSAR